MGEEVAEDSLELMEGEGEGEMEGEENRLVDKGCRKRSTLCRRFDFWTLQLW